MENVKQQIDFDQVTLRDLALVLRARALLVALCTLFFGVAAGVAAFIAPAWYEATVVLSPIASPASGGMGSSATSQLGGLAALAGISVGTDSRKSESIAKLQSEALTERYIEANNLLPTLYADQWDPVNQKWKGDKVAPTLWTANQYFKKTVRTVATDAKTGIINLTIKWKDPQKAADWANGLVEMTNESLRDTAIKESEMNIAYLTAEAAKTSIVEARQAIYAILQGEINKAMLARGSKEYAFRVIDPARRPEKKSSPIRSLWIVVGLFAGFAISTFGVFVHSSWK